MSGITQNGSLKRDDNDYPVMGGTSSSDNATIINAAFDPITRRLLVSSAGGGTGTVTTVSVVSANGFAGTVANPTTTPAITLSTSVTGILKGDGTAVSAGTAGDVDSILPTQTSNSGKFLTTNGTNSSWATVSGSGTVNSGTAGQLAYYAASAAAVSGNANITISSAALTIGIGGTAQGTLLLAGLTSGTTTLTAAATASGTLTLPAATDTLVGKATTDVLTNKTLTTPVINGTSTGTGVSATPTASIIAMWDANKNLSANNLIDGFTTTATAGATTTLVIGSTGLQVFTGSLTQTVLLPTTGVVAGQQFTIINQSTGAVTVQSSGANTITILATATSATFTSVVASPTTAANWNSQYFADKVASGKALTVSNTLTLAGTDGTTMTFPGSSATIARIDAANTFVGTQTITTIAGLTTVTGAASNMTITAGTGNSRTMILQTTTSGGAATTSLTLNADQTATFAAGATIGGTLALGANSITMSGSIGVTGTRITKGWFTDIESTNVPTVGGTALPTLAAGQTWTGQNKFNNLIDVNNAIAASANAATVPVTFRLNTVTNNSAATLTITMTTTSAVDGQMTLVRILDSSAAAQTITWVNTENSTVSAPTTSNGSTTLFLTVGFIYNAGTTKWRCIASA